MHTIDNLSHINVVLDHLYIQFQVIGFATYNACLFIVLLIDFDLFLSTHRST